MERERNESGQYSDRIPPETVLEAFDKRADLARPLTASDVVDELGIARRTAHNKLNALVERGELETRKVGARGRVWWVPIPAEATPDLSGASKAAESAREHAETSPPEDTGRSSGTDTGGQERAQAPADDAARDGPPEDLADAVREHLEATDQPPKTAHGRGVILDVFRLLREHGTMPTGDLQDEIYPEYSDHWGSGRTMWNAVDRYLEDIPGIEKGGYGKWTYAGDDAVRAALAESDADAPAAGVYDPSEEF